MNVDCHCAIVIDRSIPFIYRAQPSRILLKRVSDQSPMARTPTTDPSSAKRRRAEGAEGPESETEESQPRKRVVLIIPPPSTLVSAALCLNSPSPLKPTAHADAQGQGGSVFCAKEAQARIHFLRHAFSNPKVPIPRIAQGQPLPAYRLPPSTAAARSRHHRSPSRRPRSHEARNRSPALRRP